LGVSGAKKADFLSNEREDLESSKSPKEDLRKQSKCNLFLWIATRKSSSNLFTLGERENNTFYLYKKRFTPLKSFSKNLHIFAKSSGPKCTCIMVDF
jgi:hypothetical protein